MHVKYIDWHTLVILSYTEVYIGCVYNVHCTLYSVH